MINVKRKHVITQANITGFWTDIPFQVVLVYLKRYPFGFPQTTFFIGVISAKKSI